MVAATKPPTSTSLFDPEARCVSPAGAIRVSDPCYRSAEATAVPDGNIRPAKACLHTPKSTPETANLPVVSQLEAVLRIAVPVLRGNLSRRGRAIKIEIRFRAGRPLRCACQITVIPGITRMAGRCLVQEDIPIVVIKRIVVWRPPRISKRRESCKTSQIFETGGNVEAHPVTET